MLLLQFVHIPAERHLIFGVNLSPHEVATSFRKLPIMKQIIFTPKEVLANAGSRIRPGTDGRFSLLLGRTVKILSVLPADTTRLADETSLVIMDIVVELEDNSIANCEIQRQGYAFPGQRSACYSADLLLRQYKRVKSQNNKKKFNYREIKKVYTIIFFEKSTQEFHDMPDTWLHYCKQTSNTGLKVELLQEYIFIPLDIFRVTMQNKAIESKLEAWLSFFSMDEPERVLELVERYPEFKPMYEEVYTICRNIGRIMDMFSKELQEMDQNTVYYMIDEMQGMIDKQKGTIDEQKGTIDEQQNTIAGLKKELSEISVHSFIKACRKFTNDKSTVTNQLQEEFSLSQEKALELVDKHWSENV